MARIRSIKPEWWADDELPFIPRSDIETAASRLLGGWGYHGSKHWPSYARERWVYFVRGDDSGPIKIGHTRCLLWRASELQVAYPFGMLDYVGVFLGVAADEGALHRKFAAAHIRAEWFAPSVELVAFIRSLGGVRYGRPSLD